jgi:hypothetical protein
MTCILCNACYYLGDFWSKLIRFVPDRWEWFGENFAKPYFVLMRWSVDLNDRGNCGVWGSPESRGAEHG